MRSGRGLGAQLARREEDQPDGALARTQLGLRHDVHLMHSYNILRMAGIDG